VRRCRRFISEAKKSCSESRRGFSVAQRCAMRQPQRGRTHGRRSMPVIRAD
jgi:hypothetical protein